MRYSGNSSHSRWLNTANGVLRYYISEQNPSESSEIKTKSKCYNGASNLYKMINSSRYLRPELRKIVDPVLKRNAYFAHPENILIEMLKDKRLSVRKLALKRILKARSKPQPKKIRDLKVPPINLNAKSYVDMINWHKVTITEPPLTSTLSDIELQSIVDEGAKDDLFNLPCHTQAVERCVKVNTALTIVF